MIMDMKEDLAEVLHYDIPDNPVFFRNNDIPGWYDFREEFLHWHDEVEFIYVYEGSVWYQVNDKHIHLACGEGIFVNSRQLHVISTDHVNTKLYCMIIHPTILCASGHIARNYVEALINHKGLPFIKFHSDICWEKNLLDAIARINGFLEEKEKNDMDHGQDLSVIQELFHIWQLIYKNTSSLEVKKEDSHRNDNLSLVKTMLIYIQNHYSERISLKEICHVASIGKTKATSLFAQYMNTSPIEYLNSYRLEVSLHQLMDTEKSITEIACDCGFSDSSYYGRQFRRKYGMKPMQARKMKHIAYPSHDNEEAVAES